MEVKHWTKEEFMDNIRIEELGPPQLKHKKYMARIYLTIPTRNGEFEGVKQAYLYICFSHNPAMQSRPMFIEEDGELPSQVMQPVENAPNLDEMWDYLNKCIWVGFWTNEKIYGIDKNKIDKIEVWRGDK